MQIEALFKQSDSDGSGTLEYEEFVKMVKGMNPQEANLAVQILLCILSLADW